jgi:hypothetical protein
MTWFSEISNKKFYMMLFNRPKPHFVVDHIKGIIYKETGNACAAIFLLIVVIVVIVVVL